MENEITTTPPPTETDLNARLNARIQELPPEQRNEVQTLVLEQTRIINERLSTQNKEIMTKAIEEWKASQEPPSAEDVQKMLDGESPTFQVILELRGQKKSFRIRELSAKVEKKVIRLVRDRLTPKLGLLGQLTNEIMEGTIADKVAVFFEVLEPATGLVSETVALILAHSQDGEETATTYSADEVDESLSMQKQILVLNAQMAANRLRDFFSHVSRLIK